MTPATVLALFSLSHPSSHADRPVEACPAHLVAHFNDVDDAMRHLRHQIQQVKQRLQRQYLQKDLDAAITALQRARVAACRAAQGGPPIVVAPPPPPPPRVLSDGEYQELMDTIRRESFDDGRLGVLALGVRGVCVTSEQTKGLVREMTFSQARLDAIRVLASRMIDRHNAYVVLDALSFDSDKRAARDILSSTAQAPECTPHDAASIGANPRR